MSDQRRERLLLSGMVKTVGVFLFLDFVVGIDLKSLSVFTHFFSLLHTREGEAKMVRMQIFSGNRGERFTIHGGNPIAL